MDTSIKEWKMTQKAYLEMTENQGKSFPKPETQRRFQIPDPSLDDFPTTTGNFCADGFNKTDETHHVIFIYDYVDNITTENDKWNSRSITMLVIILLLLVICFGLVYMVLTLKR